MRNSATLFCRRLLSTAKKPPKKTTKGASCESKTTSNNSAPTATNAPTTTTTAATSTNTTANTTTSPPNQPNPSTIEVFVNDKPVQVATGSVIIQACAEAGIDIPRFCYHERLAVAGNCRMCLVQVEKMPKMVASCAQPVAPGMRIITDSPQVKKAREGVMEFLLANHPLDCAICDQGGECDLQDQAMAFGSDRSRLSEPKRAVEDKDFGPLIKTSMNRCIHCTRCVRFANEIGGLPQLGTTGRGNDMQIGTYIGELLGSELSANVIDLCPVGALTSRPYAFAARPWELRKTESVDVLDAVGSAIRIDTRGVELMRIQPRTNDAVNEEWLSDKSRFVSDGLKVQRLTTSLVDGGQVSWRDALQTAADFIKNEEKLVAISGPFADVETLYAVKEMIGVGESLLLAPSLFDGPKVEIAPPKHSLNQSGLTLQEMEEIDALLVIGTNLRHDAPLLNVRLRKAFFKNPSFRAAVVGAESAEAQLNFDFEFLGKDISDLRERVKKSHFWKHLGGAKRPAIMISESLLSEHPDSAFILKEFAQLGKEFLRPEWNGVCVVPRAASHVGAKLIGWQGGVANEASKALKEAGVVLMIGSGDAVKPELLVGKKVIYIGHHADLGALNASLVLPATAYPEKSATFVNLEGRVQRTQAAMAPLGDAREDWQIIRALSEFVGKPLSFDSVEELRKNIPWTVEASLMRPSIKDTEKELMRVAKLPVLAGAPSKLPFSAVAIKDFYLTDVISRASATMAKCSLAFTQKVATSTGEIDHLVKQLRKE